MRCKGLGITKIMTNLAVDNEKWNGTFMVLTLLKTFCSSSLKRGNTIATFATKHFSVGKLCVAK